MNKVNEHFQLVPPHMHGRKAAERASFTFNDHFISMLAISHKDFHIHLSSRLVTHDIITLNIMRQSKINPKLSYHAVLNGEFNYNATKGMHAFAHTKMCEA